MRPIYHDALAAVADIPHGATIMVGGFAGVGTPFSLIAAVNARQIGGLTIIANGVNAGTVLRPGIEANLVAKAIVSFPVPATPRPGNTFEEGFEDGSIELEIVPQGTLAERIRAGGAGVEAFYTPTGPGTPFAEGKEARDIGGRLCVLEYALRADFALVRAHRADTMGNLVYRNAMRNFNPIMASAARVTIAEVDGVVEAGTLDPETVVTPGIFVHRLVVASGSGPP